MKERPILFSAAMVRALLDGSKTQTRRVVKPQPEAHLHMVRSLGDGVFQFAQDPHQLADTVSSFHYPYGQPGDQLWVRENFSGPHYQSKSPPRDWLDTDPIWYWADGNPDGGDWTKPKPNIHMPRWASRITLEITGVRVERLHDISEEDAQAEGSLFELGALESTILGARAKYRSGYCRLWESINGPGSWNENPWVWVIEFKRSAS